MGDDGMQRVSGGAVQQRTPAGAQCCRERAGGHLAGGTVTCGTRPAMSAQRVSSDEVLVCAEGDTHPTCCSPSGCAERAMAPWAQSSFRTAVPE